jgi:hypothetical protein
MVCGFFNDTISSSDYTAYDTKINKLERMWKEAVVA